MATEVFNRSEKKYIVTQEMLRELLPKFEQVMLPDAYHKEKEFYTISNIYFDTADNYYIRTSLEKPGYKEKLRLRGYGVPAQNDRVYLEIKKKVTGIVNKRRSPLLLREAAQFIDTGKYPEQGNTQVLREIQYILQCRELIPKLYLAYDRKAYYCRDNPGLRITFDKNIRTRRFDLHLDSGDFGYPLLRDELWLMEIKTEQGLPLWLTQILSKYELYPASFSKYGAEYLRMVDYQKIQGGTGSCLKPYLRALLVPLSQPEEHFLVS